MGVGWTVILQAVLTVWLSQFDHPTQEDLSTTTVGSFERSLQQSPAYYATLNKVRPQFPEDQQDEKRQSFSETPFPKIIAVSNLYSGMQQESPTVNVNMDGYYHWELIFDIDNRNNSGHYERVVEFEKVTKESYSDLREVSLETAIKTGQKLEASASYEVFSVSASSYIDVSIASAYKATVERRSETTVTTKEKQTFHVGANSKLAVYQLIFVGPGVTYKTGIISTNPDPKANVTISCSLFAKSFLKDIDVVYSSSSVERPQNLILDNNYHENDINKGFGGKYVWLVPVWTNHTNEAATSFQIAIQGQRNDRYKDLAAGAGGSFRYLLRMFDSRVPTRIHRVGLLRGPNGGGELYNRRKAFGWDECTRDINQDRKGDWLYLCWNNYHVGRV